MAMINTVGAALLFVGANASYGIGGFPGYFEPVGDDPSKPAFDYWTKEPSDDSRIAIYTVGSEGPSRPGPELLHREEARSPAPLVWAKVPGQNSDLQIPETGKLPLGDGGGPIKDHKEECGIVWNYAPDTEGTIEFDNSGLGPGVYKSFFLSNDGFASIVTPVIFTVGNAAEYPGSLDINLNAKPWYLRWATTKRIKARPG
ncbi:hypothetical protein PWT90_07164 [Aphanocladium album]|nr:hypothetical protein PWT90_07164 [Aphanocladium album]